MEALKMKFKISFKMKIYFCLVVVLGIVTGSVLFSQANNKSKPDIMEISGLVPLISFEEMVATSPLIVEGTIDSSTQSKWNTDDGLEPNEIKFEDSIYHDIVVTVDKTLKGLYSDKTLVVRVYNGEIPNGKTVKKLISKGYPDYSINEKVILFLSYDSTPYNKIKLKDHYITTGMLQGKFTITDKKAKSNKEPIDLDKLYIEIDKYKDSQPKLKYNQGNP
jgi:hypothetical protein